MKNRVSKFIIFAMTGFLLLMALLFFVSQSPVLNQQAHGLPSAAMSRLTKIFRAPYDWTRQLGANLDDLFSTYQENQSLKAQLTLLENQAGTIAELEADNASLRQQLGIKEKFSPKTSLPTRVLVRSSLAWLETVTIDQGSDQGVKEGMLLVTDKGLVGTLRQIDANTSQVDLLTNSQTSSALPLKIKSGDQTIYGILTGYDAQEQAILISQLNSQEEIMAGAPVSTSGLDGETLADVPLGQVIKVTNTSDQGRLVYVQSAVDFSSLDNLLLIGR